MQFTGNVYEDDNEHLFEVKNPDGSTGGMVDQFTIDHCMVNSKIYISIDSVVTNSVLSGDVTVLGPTSMQECEITNSTVSGSLVNSKISDSKIIDTAVWNSELHGCKSNQSSIKNCRYYNIDFDDNIDISGYDRDLRPDVGKYKSVSVGINDINLLPYNVSMGLEGINFRDYKMIVPTGEIIDYSALMTNFSGLKAFVEDRLSTIIHRNCKLNLGDKPWEALAINVIQDRYEKELNSKVSISNAEIIHESTKSWFVKVDYQLDVYNKKFELSDIILIRK